MKIDNLPPYNTFLNNYSDEVEKALEYAGFFVYSDYINQYTIPGTTPGGLGFDINVELFLKNLFN